MVKATKAWLNPIIVSAVTVMNKETQPNYFFQKVPIYGPVIRRADELVRKASMGAALRYGVDALKWRALVNCPQETISVLSSEASLVVVNHPAQIEPLLVAWAISHWRPNPDIFLVGDADLTRTGADLSRLFVPIYGTTTRSTRRLTSLRKRAQVVLFGVEDETAFDRRNMASLAQTVEIFEQGGVVVITPMRDPKEESDRWTPGVGWIAKNTLRRGFAPQVVMADVSGTSPLDFLRFLPGANTFLPALKMEFSLPTPLAHVVRQEDLTRNKPITENLQAHYEAWLATRRVTA